jgi:hypothetical protein
VLPLMGREGIAHAAQRMLVQAKALIHCSAERSCWSWSLRRRFATGDIAEVAAAAEPQIESRY